MEKHLWQKIKATYFTVLEAPESERLALLEKICTDPVIEFEVKRLLVAETKTSASIKESQCPLETAGVKEIGPYRILDFLGEGGMGRVFLVEKKDSEFNQKFALKLVNTSVDHDEFHKRFDMERHILASLNHPNIARFIDGGISDNGSYFCMEYIEGKPIDIYCDEHQCTIKDRIELFNQVFDAVHFAHSHFIVHRDLKPGNILVSNSGRVKLLDFGIAKLMEGHENQDLGMLSQLTRDQSQGPMTPLYASPEQYLGEPITAASDVYGLGLVLYQLVTGHLAYDFKNKSLLEIDSLIVKQMPTEPSDRCGDPILKGYATQDIADNRKTTQEKLKDTLKGDLDIVLLKSLQKDPAQRYASVAEFQQDLECYLNRQPISARPPSIYYRTKMFGLRHKVSVLFAVILLCSFVLGTIGTLVGWQQALKAKNTALEEANKSKEILSFVETMLGSADPGEMGKDVKIVEALDRSAALLDDEFKQQPEIKAAIHYTLGKTYGSLGEFERGIRHLEKACEVRKTVYSDHDRTLLEYQSSLGSFLQEMGSLSRATEILERLDVQMTELFGKEDRTTLLNFVNLVNLNKKKGELVKAEEMIRVALDIQIKQFGKENEDTVASLSILGGLLAEQSRFDEAYKQHSEVYQLMKKKYSSEHPLVLKSQDNVATIIIRQGKFAEAEAELKTILNLKRKVMGEDHPATFKTVINLTTTLNYQEKFDEAKVLSLAYLDRVKEKMGEDHFLTLEILNGLSNSYSGLKKFEKVRDIQQASLKLKIQKFGPEHSQTITSMINLGNAYNELEDYTKAFELHQQAYIASKKTLGENHYYSLIAYTVLAIDTYFLGQVEEAISKMEEACERFEDLFGADHASVKHVKGKLKKMKAGEGLDDP